jgi:hypothetical protein
MAMKEHRVTVPELALIAGTRAAAGAGLGLLLSNRLSESQRRAAGWSLFLVGALSTIPLAWEVLGRRREVPGVDVNAGAIPPRSEAEVRFDRPASMART